MEKILSETIKILRMLFEETFKGFLETQNTYEIIKFAFFILFYIGIA